MMMFEKLRADWHTYECDLAWQGLWVMAVYRFGRRGGTADERCLFPDRCIRPGRVLGARLLRPSKRLWPERRGERFAGYRRDGADAGDEPPFLSPEQVIRELNRRFCREPEADLAFLTMVYGVLEVRTGRIRLSSAGHPPPLVWRRAERGFVESRVRGMPVGVLEESRHDSEALTLDPGDRMFVYTDGIVECLNPGGELFGPDRFRAVLRDTAEAFLAEVGTAVSETLRLWRGSEAFPDDISLLFLER